MKTCEGTNGASQEKNHARPIISGAEVPHDVGSGGKTVREEALQSAGEGVAGRSVSMFARGTVEKDAQCAHASRASCSPYQFLIPDM